MPNLQRYLCTDAVPESTFVSEFYTKFRAIQSKVTVVHSMKSTTCSIRRARMSRSTLTQAITSRGYEMVVKRDKYHRSPDTQRFGLFPSTYFLFRRVRDQR